MESAIRTEEGMGDQTNSEMVRDDADDLEAPAEGVSLEPLRWWYRGRDLNPQEPESSGDFKTKRGGQ